MDKQKEYLDKVLERLKSETEFKVVPNDEPVGHKYDYYWKYPFSEFTTLSPYYPTNKSSNFHKHCRDIYGLSNEEVEDYILPNYYNWFKYNNPLYKFSNVENLFKNTTINESEDKQKNFFDRVLERLLKETVITDSKITFPFAIFKQPELTGDSLLSVSQWIDGMWENHKYPHRFEKYVNDIYGITYMESLGLWNSYMDIIEKEILKRLRRNKSNVATIWNLGRHDINESQDLNEKQKGYLDKVVAHLLRETEIDYEKWRVNYPFFENTTYSFQYTLPFSGPFIRYCNNIFPLSEDEKKYVHGMYTGIVNSKIRKYYVDNDIYNKYYNVMGTKDIINFDR